MNLNLSKRNIHTQFNQTLKLRKMKIIRLTKEEETDLRRALIIATNLLDSVSHPQSKDSALADRIEEILEKLDQE